MVAQHGHSKYTNDGCRCDTCRAANTAWMRGHIRKPIDPGKHGTDVNYRRGCRCDPCRGKHNELERITRARRRHGARADAVADALAKPPAPARPYRPASSGPAEHGTLTRYTGYCCRCDACRAAMAAYMRERRARKRAAA